MAGRRRYNGRRRTFRRRYTRKRRYVRRTNGRKTRLPLTHVEYNFVDTTFNFTFAATGSFTLVNGAAQGVAANNRTGNTQWNKSLQLNFSINRSGSSATVTDYVAMYILYDTDTDNVAPVGTAFQAAGQVNPFGMRELANRNRWLILKKRVFKLTDQMLGHVFTYYKRFSLRTVFTGAGADIANIRSGAIFVYFVTDNGATPPNVFGEARVRFTDA